MLDELVGFVCHLYIYILYIEFATVQGLEEEKEHGDPSTPFESRMLAMGLQRRSNTCTIQKQFQKLSFQTPGLHPSCLQHLLSLSNLLLLTPHPALSSLWSQQGTMSPATTVGTATCTSFPSRSTSKAAPRGMWGSGPSSFMVDAWGKSSERCVATGHLAQYESV